MSAKFSRLGCNPWTDACTGSPSNSIPELALDSHKISTLEVATSEVYLPFVISNTWNSSVHPLPSVKLGFLMKVDPCCKGCVGIPYPPMVAR